MQPGSLHFDVAAEYGIPGLASAYAQSGVTSVKLRPEFGKWGNLEPSQGERHWETLDLLVSEFQEAGFQRIHLVLMADSPWASIAPTNGGGAEGKNTFPKAEFVDEYAAFVRDVVERYDGDGVEDMAGLRYPIYDYAVEAEFSGFWPGSADDYLRLLRIAYPAIHAANPAARVSLVALLAVDVFDGAPDDAEIERRFERPFSGRKSRAEIEQVLSACDAYDLVDFHSLGDYTEILPTAQWIQARLTESGCQKPLLIGDAFSMSMLVGYLFSTFHPATLTQRAEVVAWLQAVADPAAEEHVAATAWLHAEMARSLVRKVVTAAGAGTVGINIGNFEDWKSGVPTVDRGLVPAIGTSAFMGMMTVTQTAEYAGSPLPYTQAEFSRIKAAGAERASFGALQLVHAKLLGAQSVNRIELGENIWAWRVERLRGPLWVLWYDDNTLYLPGAELPQTTIALPFPAQQAQLTYTPTSAEQSQTVTETLPVTDGEVLFPLSTTPIFVEIATTQY